MVRRKTVKRGRKTIKRRISSRKLVSSSLRKSFPRDQKGMPKIYVINLKKDKTKWKKYKEDHKKGIIDRYSACLGIDPQTKYRSKFKENEGRLQIMWNAAEKKKKCTAGILTSHLGIVQKIHSSKHSFPKNGVLIIEDDAHINFSRLKLAMKSVHKYNDSIIYFGGTLHPPDTFKNKVWYGNIDSLRKTFQKNKINTIDPSKYRILGGHGYYFPTWNTVDTLLTEINKKKKIRALDSEMVKLQKKGIIKYFYYPAISYLNIEDAMKGVHAGYFDTQRNMEFYG
tara:strand:+ start:2143 stop:2991 length:849 start_codon:yes stop_codon:yes gene_type:complete